MDLTALLKETEETEGLDSSLNTFLNGYAAAIKDAVAKALAADRAANETSNAAAQTAIDDVTARFVAARTPVAAALLANSLPGDPAPVPAPAGA